MKKILRQLCNRILQYNCVPVGNKTNITRERKVICERWCINGKEMDKQIV